MNIKRPLIVTGLLLLIPLLGMQLSDDVDWGWIDFLIAGLLLSTAGFSYELMASKVEDRARRMVIGAAILFVLLIIWAELAVGLFGTPFAGS